MPDQLRIVVAEDAALLREGLVGILTSVGHVVRAVDDADALVAAVRNDPPDVVITDVRMPPTFSDEGLRAAAEIRAGNDRIGILEGGPQHTARVGHCSRRNHLEAGHVRVPAFEAVRVLRGKLAAGAGGHSDHQWHGNLSA